MIAHRAKCACQETILTDVERSYLHKIGLSKHAVELYNLLLVLGPLTAQAVTSHRSRFVSAQYRLFYELEAHNLVRRDGGRPRTFTALPLTLGLQSSLVSTEKQLESMLAKSLSGTEQSSDILEIIHGRQAMYDSYVHLAARAEKEVCIYAIGIAFSDKIEATHRSLIRRGVRIRHIVQQHKISNLHVISKWLKLGVKLRYLPQPRGFHFFLVDGHQICITFSDPHDTDQRFSILTDNQAAARLFQETFENLWREAQDITLS